MSILAGYGNAAKLQQLQAKVETLRQDAARYRWLRETKAEEFGDEYGFTYVYVMSFDDFKQPKRGLDAAMNGANA